MSEAPQDTPLLSPSSIKRCDYCGREADQEVAFCAGCGTPFPPSSDASDGASVLQHAAAVAPAGLGARSATVILLIFLAAQFAGGFFVFFVAALNSRPTGAPPPTATEIAAFVQQVMPFALTAGTVAEGVAMLVASLRIVPTALRDTSATGAAWTIGSWRRLLVASTAGVFIAIALANISTIPFIRPTHFAPGPLARMSTAPGLPQTLWVVNALLAPPIEELLFRGVLYGGYRRSFGPAIAATLSTGIFWLLHLTETIHNLPAALGIAMMALVALWFRLRSAAVGPAVAAHLGYNAALVAIVLTSGHMRH